MTPRIRIRLASLAIANLCLFAAVNQADAFELLDQLLGKGGTACGCDAAQKHTAKGGGAMLGKSAGHSKSSDCCCNIGTPVLDAMTDFTRTVKCHMHAMHSWQMPSIELPTLDLSSMLPCNRCCSATKGKGGGKVPTPAYAPANPGPVYHSPGTPVEPPPAPVVDAEA